MIFLINKSQKHILHLLLLHGLIPGVVRARTDLGPNLSLVEPHVPVSQIALPVEGLAVEAGVKGVVVAGPDLFLAVFVVLEALHFGGEVGSDWVCGEVRLS